MASAATMRVHLMPRRRGRSEHDDMKLGEVIGEEKGYFGRTVFRAARIAELGKGGQVLASEATKVLADIAPDARFVDLGEQELDGLGGSHRVFEVLPAEQVAGRT